MFKKVLTASLVSTLVALGACSSDDDETPMAFVTTPGVGNSVYDNIVNNPDLATLRTAIDEAGLASTLDNEESQFTVFAPNNAAFQALEDLDPNDDAIADLIADPTTLASILTYHVLPGTIDSAAAAAAAPANLTTVNGAEVAVAASGTAPTGLSIGGADILDADSDYVSGTSVGVVHVISSVLSPPAE